VYPNKHCSKTFAARSTKLSFTFTSYIPRRKEEKEKSVVAKGKEKLYGCLLKLDQLSCWATGSSCTDDTRHPRHDNRCSGMSISVRLRILVFEVQFGVVSLQVTAKTIISEIYLRGKWKCLLHLLPHDKFKNK